MGAVLVQNGGQLYKYKIDLAYCRIGYFDIELKPGTSIVSSLSYCRVPIISTQVNSLPDSYLAASLIELPTSQ